MPVTPSRVAPTVFASYSRRQARVALAVTVVSIAALMLCTLPRFSKTRVGDPTVRGEDIALYVAEARRVAAGENYYAVAADELRQRGFPTKSVFNWRTPLPTSLIAAFGEPGRAKLLLGLLVTAGGLLALAAVAQESSIQAAMLTSILLIGALVFAVLGDSFVMSELWAAAFITLSLGAYGVGRHPFGAALGIVGLFMRELVGPYCVVGLVFALVARRRGEVLVWLVGLAAYAGYFACHVAEVRTWQSPDDIAHAGTWLQAGGAAFLVALAQVNALLITLPQPLAAIYLGLALLGVAGWKTAFGRRIAWTTLCYVLLFGIVGYNFNQYWGALLAPLLCYGVAQAPAALFDLWRAARGSAKQLAAA
jgi:hypothetical protein